MVSMMIPPCYFIHRYTLMANEKWGNSVLWDGNTCGEWFPLGALYV